MDQPADLGPAATLHAALPGQLVQVAYRVPDLTAACHQWATTMGAGPFVVREHMDVKASHHGRPAVYDHSAAFGQWGPVMLELITVHRCEPEPMRAVIEHEQPGQLNHVACFVDDLAASSAALEAVGMPLVMSLVTSSGMDVNFHDGREVMGGLVELYVGTEHLRGFYDRIAALADGWDGTDVVRFAS